MVYLQLVVGLIALTLFGELLVRGAVALAVRLCIPTMIIGLTVVGFGTSAPELVVSLRAALQDSPGIAIGNVVGSNIVNVLLVLGLPALMLAIRTDETHAKRNLAYVLGASAVFILFCFFQPLSFWQGLFLFALMIGFLLESAYRTWKERASPGAQPGADIEELEAEMPEIAGIPPLVKPGWAIAALMLAGLIGLPFAAQLTVASAARIAHMWGVSETAIGLTIVAFGTSLPELATCLVATWRGHTGLALGNVLGSNLFNILAIMGLTAMVTPVPVPPSITNVDLWVMLGAAFVLLPFVLRHKPIGRFAGAIFILAYLAYIYFIFDTDAVHLVAAVR